jgi:hypothetical protein
MRRVTVSLLCSLLLLALAAPAAAAPAAKPSLAITDVCVNAFDQLDTEISWSNLPPNGGSLITHLTLKGPGLAGIAAGTAQGPSDVTSSSGSYRFVQRGGLPDGLTDWDQVTSITAWTSTDPGESFIALESKSYRQPKSGWPDCPPV